MNLTFGGCELHVFGVWLQNARFSGTGIYIRMVLGMANGRALCSDIGILTKGKQDLQ
jgi:hypothetical protein